MHVANAPFQLTDENLFLELTAKILIIIRIKRQEVFAHVS